MSVQADPWVWVVLGVLLLFSGFFSSTETALFSMTTAQRARASEPVRLLLARPRRLLLTILLSNLIVNVLFFAFAGRLSNANGRGSEWLVGTGALVAILVFGEILPKTLGLRAGPTLARWAAPWMRTFVMLIGPLGDPIIHLLERIHRLLGFWMEEERAITPEVLAGVLERGTEEGELKSSEALLLGEVFELDQVRVREIMTPRVDSLFIDLSGEDREAAVSQAVTRRLSWIPVIDREPDRVVGRVRTRELLRHPEKSVKRLVMPVKFVPEVASALDLLRGLREDRTTEAVVIDEYGGTAGHVTAEDVFEEIVGELRIEEEELNRPVVPIGEGRFRIAGSLSIRDWNEKFGDTIVPTEFETVGGLVTALLGRIPRVGDVTLTNNLELVVHEVRGRRVVSVDIGVPSEAARDEAEASS